MARVVPLMTNRARSLRTQATEAEQLIWHRVSGFRPRFTRQLVVGRCIVDLACRSVKLAIEFDGSQHIESDYDLRRTAFLEGLGWRVIRFWNSDVVGNPDGVAEAIVAEVGATR
jgi:very-short-patch-repair endonuclease